MSGLDRTAIYIVKCMLVATVYATASLTYAALLKDDCDPLNP
jgi:hypothetical protein